MRKVNLTVPTPCQEDWNQMTAVDRGRYCNACQKTVIDFSNMTDQQLAAYFKKPTGSVCGRFHQDQLERDLILSTKRLPWLRYFFQILLPAFLLSFKAQGQKNIRIGRVASHTKVPGSETTVQKPALPTANQLTGVIKDTNGNAITGASIIIKGTNQGVVSDSAGKFTLPFLKEPPFALLVSSVGYERLEHVVTDTSDKELVLALLPNMLLGEVVVVGYVQRPKKTIPLMSTRKSDTAFRQFVVYPNPVRSNSTLTIESKMLNKGDCLIQVAAMDGKIVCAKTVVLDRKGDLLRIDMPTLIPGAYLVSISNTRSRKVYTEKVQVQ